VRNEDVAVTSNSPKAVARAALEAAQRVLPFYTHPNSPKVFTQHQLFACLVLKNFWKTDYRGVVAHLADHPDLCELLRLKRVPHFTTLQKASRHLLACRPVQRVLESTIRLHYGRRRRVDSSAVDSTGLECTAASGYFVKRRHRVSDPWKTVVYHRFPKLGLVCDTSCHFILSIRVGRGPRPDVDELVPLLTAALRSMLIECLSADAGYDSEANHRFAREECGVRTLIPAKHGRPTDKPASGRYRRLMQTRFDRNKYHRRIQVEAVISMIKRRQGAHVRGRSYQAQCRDLRLMALVHNVMILLRVKVFY
jgi:Transposase DDE domain